MDSTLKLTSQLATLQKTAPTDPFGLIARTRGDVTRLQTVLQSFGYYDGAITITINGLGLDSAQLANTLAALPKGGDARVRIDPTLGPLFHVGRVDIQGALPAGMRQKMELSPGAAAVAADVPRRAAARPAAGIPRTVQALPPESTSRRGCTRLRHRRRTAPARSR